MGSIAKQKSNKKIVILFVTLALIAFVYLVINPMINSYWDEQNEKYEEGQRAADSIVTRGVGTNSK